MKKILKFGAVAFSVFCVSSSFGMLSASLSQDQKDTLKTINHMSQHPDLTLTQARRNLNLSHSLKDRLETYVILHNISASRVLVGVGNSAAAKDGANNFGGAGRSTAVVWGDEVLAVDNAFRGLLHEFLTTGAVTAGAKTAFVNAVTAIKAANHNLPWDNGAAAVTGAAYAGLLFLDAQHNSIKAGGVLGAPTNTAVSTATSRLEVKNSIMNFSEKPNGGGNAFVLGATDQAAHPNLVSAIVGVTDMWNDAAGPQLDFGGTNLAAITANDPPLTDGDYVEMLAKLFTVHD